MLIEFLFGGLSKGLLDRAQTKKSCREETNGIVRSSCHEGTFGCCSSLTTSSKGALKLNVRRGDVKRNGWLIHLQDTTRERALTGPDLHEAVNANKESEAELALGMCLFGLVVVRPLGSRNVFESECVGGTANDSTQVKNVVRQLSQTRRERDRQRQERE